MNYVYMWNLIMDKNTIYSESESAARWYYTKILIKSWVAKIKGWFNGLR